MSADAAHRHDDASSPGALPSVTRVSFAGSLTSALLGCPATTCIMAANIATRLIVWVTDPGSLTPAGSALVYQAAAKAVAEGRQDAVAKLAFGAATVLQRVLMPLWVGGSGSVPQLILICLILYQCRLVERKWGTRIFLLVLCIPSLVASLIPTAAIVRGLSIGSGAAGPAAAAVASWRPYAYEKALQGELSVAMASAAALALSYCLQTPPCPSPQEHSSGKPEGTSEPARPIADGSSSAHTQWWLTRRMVGTAFWKDNASSADKYFTYFLTAALLWGQTSCTVLFPTLPAAGTSNSRLPLVIYQSLHAAVGVASTLWILNTASGRWLCRTVDRIACDGGRRGGAGAGPVTGAVASILRGVVRIHTVLAGWMGVSTGPIVRRRVVHPAAGGARGVRFRGGPDDVAAGGAVDTEAAEIEAAIRASLAETHPASAPSLPGAAARRRGPPPRPAARAATGGTPPPMLSPEQEAAVRVLMDLSPAITREKASAALAMAHGNVELAAGLLLEE